MISFGGLTILKEPIKIKRGTILKEPIKIKRGHNNFQHLLCVPNNFYLFYRVSFAVYETGGNS